MVLGRNQVEGQPNHAQAGQLRWAKMTDQRKTKTTKTFSASEISRKLAGVVAHHEKMGKRARELAAEHFNPSGTAPNAPTG